ncbi:hypothetical protein AAC387_Pa02g4496 [Persea americana]
MDLSKETMASNLPHIVEFPLKMQASVSSKPQGIIAMVTVIAFLLERYTNVKSQAESAYRRKWRNKMRSAVTYEEWSHAAKMLD